jgi:penicillin-insensitive murein endopeptidase
MTRLMTRLPLALSSILMLSAICRPAAAQDLGTLDPKPLPPLQNYSDPKIAAKELFGRESTPSSSAPRSIGYYTHGCLAGGQELPINGPTWQVMRLSRHRNFGHPNLVKFLERFAAKAPSIGWPGLLVGDMGQPRGGPMLTGHWSHQLGLDADVWLTPMPDRELTREEREEMMATNVVNDGWTDVRPEVWSEKYVALYKMVAEAPAVERVLANPAIKKALCRDATGDRSWLRKIRPVYGHNYHFHIRISCPADSPECQKQPPPPLDEGCGKDLDWWLKPKPRQLGIKEGGASHGIPMSALPMACRTVLSHPYNPPKPPPVAAAPPAEPAKPGEAHAAKPAAAPPARPAAKPLAAVARPAPRPAAAQARPVPPDPIRQ